MKIYLSSDKLGNQYDYLKEWISLDNNNKNIILITNARDLKKQDKEESYKIKENICMLEKLGFNVSIIDLRKYFNDHSKLYEISDKFNTFCVIGGNVFVLRKAMQLSGFDRYIVNNKNSNKLYIGYSAGSCVVSNNLDGLQIVDEPINPYDKSEVNYEGVGLIDFCFVPHYKSNNKETLLINDVVKYLGEKNIKYKAVKDGDVIIEELTKN